MEYINLDITPGSIPPIVNCSQCDIGREIALILFDGTSGEWSIPEGSTVYIIGTKSDGHPFGYDSVSNPDIITWTGSTVTVKTVYQMTAAAGEAECEVRIKSTEQEIYTANFILDVESMAWPQDDELSVIDIPLIVRAINAESGSVESAAQAAASASAAKTSETNAKTSETNAKNSQTAAANSATASANSASASATSASKAATSESNASKSATAAANSATASASSATKAATSESNASKSATAAKTSETNASNSAELSESWAVGGTGSRSGEDSNNSKYYAEQAKKSADQAASTVTGVSTWNGRAGAVVPTNDDYSASMIKMTDGDSVEDSVTALENDADLLEAWKTGGNDKSNFPYIFGIRSGSYTDANDLKVTGHYRIHDVAAFSNIPSFANATSGGIFVYVDPDTGTINQFLYLDGYTNFHKRTYTVDGDWLSWGKIHQSTSNSYSPTSESAMTGKAVNEALTPTKFLLSASNWSSQQTTVNGTSYYTYTLQCTTVNRSNPIIGPAGSSTIPTQDEQTAYDCIDYAIANQSSNTITFYAETLPTVSFYVIIEGAKQ